MPLGLSFFSTRWAACQNVGDYDIPRYGIVQVTDVEHGDGHPGSSPLLFSVKRPDSDNVSPIGIVGPGEIPAGSPYPRGYMVFDGLATVTISGSIGSSTNLGSTQDSFEALIDGIGMRVLDVAGYQALVSLSSPDFANLPIVNQPSYAICLDADGCLCKTPVNTC